MQHIGHFSGLCPACGRGKLFSGVLRVNSTCPACGIALRGDEVGDGAAVPILLVLGAVIVGGALYVEFTFSPPFWVHVVIWPPLTALLVVVMTRLLKSFFIVQAYRTRGRDA